jgi:hypothetical protein
MFLLAFLSRSSGDQERNFYALRAGFQGKLAVKTLRKLKPTRQNLTRTSLMGAADEVAGATVGVVVAAVAAAVGAATATAADGTTATSRPDSHGHRHQGHDERQDHLAALHLFELDRRHRSEAFEVLKLSR